MVNQAKEVRVTVFGCRKDDIPVCANYWNCLKPPAENLLSIGSSEMICSTILSRTQRMNVRENRRTGHRPRIAVQIRYPACWQLFPIRPSETGTFYRSTGNYHLNKRNRLFFRLIFQPDAIVLSTEKSGNEALERTGCRHGDVNARRTFWNTSAWSAKTLYSISISVIWRYDNQRTEFRLLCSFLSTKGT